MSPQQPDSERRRRGGVALAGVIGGYAAVSILSGLGLGALLDHAFGSTPLFLILGVLTGFAVSFFVTYRVATRELLD